MAATFEEEDDIMLPLPEEPSSPVRPKLKRLKKASERQTTVHLPDLPPVNQTLLPDSSEQLLDPLFPDSVGLIDELRKEKSDQVTDDEPLLPDSLEVEVERIVEDDSIDPFFPDSGGLIEELRRERLEETKVRGPNLTHSENEPLDPGQDGLDDGLDPLFPEPGEYKAWGGKDIGEGGLIEELRQEKSAKKCLNFNGEDESSEKETKKKRKSRGNANVKSKDPVLDKRRSVKVNISSEKETKKKRKSRDNANVKSKDPVLDKRRSAKVNISSEKETKKKRKSRDNANVKSKDPVLNKRRSAKERRVQLDMIHAESQRLLRETSDASFKPLPIVHKPISSVLEKIRLRKLEILKKSSASFQTSEIDSSVGVESWSVDASDTRNITKDDVDLDMGGNDDQALHVKSSEYALEGEKASESHETRENSSEKQMPNSDISESASKEEDKSDSAYPSNGEHNQSENDVADNEADEVPSSSMPCTNPTVPSDDVSSSSSDDDEEEEEEEEKYNDKENIDPCSQSLSTMNNKDSRSAVLKDFVDDEAEEEDDSDHDLTRFPENAGEEDSESDESDENEVMKDLIATGYKESKRDHERRNELHLMWLEQQDEVKTDNVLQRLKYSNLHKEDLMDEVEEEDREGEGSGDDTMLSDSGAGAGGLKNILRQNSEKVKQMMMFNDDHDVYVPSDEDENEDHMLRQRMLKKQPDIKTTALLENEESREVFGLIKKLNIAPPPKRRGNQAASNLDMLTVGSNSNSFSKFFGRKGSGSMTSSRKAVIGRSFIFGRDDSNSRSGLSSDNQLSENHDKLDTDPKERNQMHKPISSSQRSSQMKSATAASSGVSSSSGSSLFEILRQSSISSDKEIEEKSQLTETQATSIYSAFKVGRGFSRVDPRF